MSEFFSLSKSWLSRRSLLEVIRVAVGHRCASVRVRSATATDENSNVLCSAVRAPSKVASWLGPKRAAVAAWAVDRPDTQRMQVRSGSIASWRLSKAIQNGSNHPLNRNGIVSAHVQIEVDREDDDYHHDFAHAQ